MWQPEAPEGGGGDCWGRVSEQATPHAVGTGVAAMKAGSHTPTTLMRLGHLEGSQGTLSASLPWGPTRDRSRGAALQPR